MNLSEILQLAAPYNFSDLHLSSGEVPSIRVDGDIVRLNHSPLQEKTVRELLDEVMNEKNRADFASHLELDFSCVINGTQRFRVNVYRHLNGLASVFRIIPPHTKSFSELGLPTKTLTNIAARPHGLVLVTGPAGSGKSTTLAAMIDHINSNFAKHILTIEDPVEYLHQNKKSIISQREVTRDTLSFNNALRSALRQDPNIILVGEIRDLETIRLALTAAETGQLVFATLHTNCATKSINRIIDFFSGEEKKLIRDQLSISLQAIVSQILLKKVGGGRVVAHEILISTPAIQNLIREMNLAQIHSIMEGDRLLGMHSLDQHLEELLEKQIISADTAKAATLAPEIQTLHRFRHEKINMRDDF